MTYGSVCSGIEAASVAWHSLGWKPAWFAEIDAFPSAVLAHHYPEVYNYGDFTKIGADARPIDVLVGGTPCQSFSVAGLRKGLDDDRGNLTLEFLKLAGRLRPRWVVWENVPGVLSIDRGRTFGAFLGGLGELGYGFAYRVLDAQYFGVPQRRRRVFVVGCLGDWRSAAAVLFERHSFEGHPAPSREAGQATARGFEIGPTSGRFTDVAPTMDCRAKDGPIRNQLGVGVAMFLNAKGGMGRLDAESETFLPMATLDASYGRLQGCSGQDARHGHSHFIPVAHTLRSEGFDASEDGTGRGTPLVPVAMAVNFRGRDGGAQAELGNEVATALRCAGGTSSKAAALIGMAVRRLTPRECERLQGFPDDYTAIPYYGKPAADGPRYKALGNSMAVPVMRWIGERIEAQK